MLLSRTKLRLNTLRVLPPAIQLSPLIMLAQLPSTRKAWGTRIVAISSPAQQQGEQRSRQAASQVCRRTVRYRLLCSRSQDIGLVLGHKKHQAAELSLTTSWHRLLVTQEMQDACQAAAAGFSSQQASNTQHTPVAVLSSRKLMKYQVLLWMSKL